MAPRLRASPLLSTFIGLMDLKLGASIITLFALLNKVAGAYGMIVLFTGGSWAQLSFYIYSVGTVAVFFYGLKRIGEEDGARSLIYAHLFAMDHLLNTVYLAYFTLLWYLYTPHDGRRIANSEAQREVMEGGAKVLEGLLTGAAGGEEGRVRAAEMVWSEERGFAGAILLTGWCIKIYFIFCLYSFALHLRRNTYHSLPLSSPSTRRNPRYIPLSRPSYPSSRTGSRAHSPVQSLLPGTLEEIRRSSTPWLGGGEGTGVVPGEEVQLEMESLAKGSGTGMSRAGSNVGAQQRNDLTGGGAGNSIGTIASGGSSSR